MVLTPQNAQLSPEQQQVVILVLIILAAVVVLSALVGGLFWYLVHSRGYGPFALFLLLPVLALTMVMFPLIWVFGASIQEWDQAHDRANLASRRNRLGDETPASTPAPQPVMSAVEADVSRSYVAGPVQRTPLPTA